MRTFTRAKVTGLVTVAAVVGTAGMAMAGTLPLPSQDALSRVLSKVGITVPATDHPATSGAVISSSRLTPPPLGATLVYPLVHLEIGSGMDVNREMGGEMDIEMDIEQQQGMASTVGEAARAATIEIADTIHDAIDATETAVHRTRPSANSWRRPQCRPTRA